MTRRFVVTWRRKTAPEFRSHFCMAESSREAVDEAKNKCSVSELHKGVVFSVWELSEYPEKFHVAYDGPPLTEMHTASSAKLVTKELGVVHADDDGATR